MISLENIPFSSEKIVDFLKRQLQFKDVCQRLLAQDLIERTAQEQGVVVEADEIQTEADSQRRQRRLENAKDTYSWLTDQLVTPEVWEAGIRDRLLAKKLAQHLFDKQVEAYFVEHRLEFEQVCLYRITVPYEPLAQELFYRIEEGEISFYEAAHLYDVEDMRRSQCGYEGRPHRWALSPPIAAIVFSAKPGEVVGPMKSEQGYDLFWIEEFIAAELNDDTRQMILNRLFQAWLETELIHFVAHHTPVS